MKRDILNDSKQTKTKLLVALSGKNEGTLKRTDG